MIEAGKEKGMSEIGKRLIESAKQVAGGQVTILLSVECGHCGWKGRRKPGNVVQCPKCGSFAAFQCPPTS